MGRRLRDSDETTTDDETLYEAYRASFEPAIEAMAEISLVTVSVMLGRTYRYKTLDRVREKLRRETGRLSTIQDIAGFRIVVEDLPDQEFALELMRRELPSSKVTDYRQNAPRGYRAIHVIAPLAGRRVELQIRTTLQNEWANT